MDIMMKKKKKFYGVTADALGNAKLQFYIVNAIE